MGGYDYTHAPIGENRGPRTRLRGLFYFESDLDLRRCNLKIQDHSDKTWATKYYS